MKKEDIVRVLAAVLQFSGLSAASEPQWGGYTKQKIGSTPRNCTNSFEEIAHGFRLVARSLADLAHPQRMSLEDTLALVRTAQPFADVTNTHCAIYSAPSAAAAPETYTAFFSPPPSAQRENAELTAAAMVGNASAHSIARWMAQLTSIDTRHPHTRGGLRASKAVFDACRRIVAAVGAEGAAARVVTSLRKVTHTNMLQYSVILRVEPKRDGSSLLDSNASDPSPPVVILAANLDSFNLYNPMSGGSPGANDNASGCATIFEVLRLIISFGYIPKRPIEFHW
ncbi:hypothetical protein HDU83_000021 [Entophlyctis luteolus]|nr:hypothetical protein HDU83_000021 [Entophlyctis luteolus]